VLKRLSRRYGPDLLSTTPEASRRSPQGTVLQIHGFCDDTVQMRGERAMTRPGRSIISYAAGGLSAGVVGFLSLPVFTRIFTPEDFGVIGLFAAGVALLAPALMIGGHVFVLYDSRRAARPSGAQEAAILLSVFSVAVVLVVGASLWLGGVVPRSVAWVAGLALLTAWFNALILLRRQTFQADGRPHAFFWLSATPPVLAFLLTLVLAASVHGWLSRLLALLTAAAVAAAWSVMSLRREKRLNFKLGWQRLGEVLRFGAPLVFSTVSIWIVAFADRYIVAERVSLAEAGIYTVAYSLALGVSSLHEGVSRYFVSRLPGLVKSDGGRMAAARFAYRYAAVALLSIPVFIPLGLVGIKLLATKSFAAGSSLLFWLIPAQTFAGMVRIPAAYLLVESRTKTRAALGVAEAATNVGLTWVLVGVYGVVGAAVATLITYATSMSVTYAVARRGVTLAPVRDVLGGGWMGQKQ
jgi:O-antigen/teichoic acid export membrane protein